MCLGFLTGDRNFSHLKVAACNNDSSKSGMAEVVVVSNK